MNESETGNNSRHRANPVRPWWPFWVVLILYIPVRLAMVTIPTPITLVVSLFDPVTLFVAVVLGLTARIVFSQKDDRIPSVASDCDSSKLYLQSTGKTEQNSSFKVATSLGRSGVRGQSRTIDDSRPNLVSGIYPSSAQTTTAGGINPKAERLLNRIERNLIRLEKAALAGEWKEASIFAARQDRLLVEYQKCEGATEEQLTEFLSIRGMVRCVREPDFMDWVSEELFKRGLQPM